MRRYDDPIEVRQRARAGAGTGGAGEGDERRAPESFIWRGRRYRVHAVIGHWYERTPWWRHALAPARASADAFGAVDAGGGPGNGADADGSESPGLVLQEEIWRVEAAPARAGGCGQLGVFELAKGCRWRLIGIAD